MEAVCSEPLSAANFPDKQGIYRESPRFWAPLQALAAQEMKSFQCVAAGSMLRRTGNLFWGNREILPLEKPRVLVLCPRDTVTKSVNFFEDGVRGCGPDEGSRLGVVILDEAIDFADQIGD